MASQHDYQRIETDPRESRVVGAIAMGCALGVFLGLMVGNLALGVAIGAIAGFVVVAVVQVWG